MIRSLLHAFAWCLVAAMALGYFMSFPPAPAPRPEPVGTVIAHLHGDNLLVKPAGMKDVTVHVNEKDFKLFRDGDTVLLKPVGPDRYELEDN